MPELGRAALVVAFGLSLYALGAGAWAVRHNRRRLATSAQNALVAAFGATLVAALVLWTALARDDFRFIYVAEHIARDLPLRYALAGFWSGQEGSLLLWLLILTGFSSAALLLARRRGRRELAAWATPLLGLVASAFAFLVVVVASPFATQPRAARGERHDPEPAEPVHAGPPAAALPRLRRPHIPWAFALGPSSPAGQTSAGSSPAAAGRSPRGRSSASASCSAPTGRTRRSGGAATTRGIRSRTRR